MSPMMSRCFVNRVVKVARLPEYHHLMLLYNNVLFAHIHFCKTISVEREREKRAFCELWRRIWIGICVYLRDELPIGSGGFGIYLWSMIKQWSTSHVEAWWWWQLLLLLLKMATDRAHGVSIGGKIVRVTFTMCSGLCDLLASKWWFS